MYYCGFVCVCVYKPPSLHREHLGGSDWCLIHLCPPQGIEIAWCKVGFLSLLLTPQFSKKEIDSSLIWCDGSLPGGLCVLFLAALAPCKLLSNPHPPPRSHSQFAFISRLGKSMPPHLQFKPHSTPATLSFSLPMPREMSLVVLKTVKARVAWVQDEGVNPHCTCFWFKSILLLLRMSAQD